MKNLASNNRVVQGDRVIEGRVIKGDYCKGMGLKRINLFIIAVLLKFILNANYEVPFFL